MMATFFGLNVVFDAKPHTWMDVGLLFVFYGLYYGVLGRDIAEICADKMASHIGVSALSSQKFIDIYVCNEQKLVTKTKDSIHSL
jgi:hypothetical protein